MSLVCVVTACSSPDAETYYRQGKELREANEPVAAMEAFIAATRVNSTEYIYKGRSYSNMATMCRIGERHELAYALYEQSAEQFLLSQDTLAYAFALNNIAWEQAVIGQKAQALALMDSAIFICPDELLQNKVVETKAAAYLYAEQYDSLLLYTQHVPVKSVYFDILRSQAYTFIAKYDSALYYARLVVEQTDNPRYLDDAYYILTQYDSTAQADDIRALAATRADIQRSLERNDATWMEAMLLAEEALKPSGSLIKGEVWILLVFFGIAFIGGVTILVVRIRRRRICTMEQQYRTLRQSKKLRDELQLDDYGLFCAVCNERLGGIADKLEQRGLSEREIRICVLVLIGLSYAEIAEVLYRAESGIGKDKYVIAKRLGVSVKDLQDTLRQITSGK